MNTSDLTIHERELLARLVGRSLANEATVHVLGAVIRAPGLNGPAIHEPSHDAAVKEPPRRGVSVVLES